MNNNEPRGDEPEMKWLGDDPAYDAWCEKIAKENLKHQIKHDEKENRD